MFSIRTRILTLLGMIFVFPGCGGQSEAPVIDKENAEDINLVAYLSHGDSDWKNVGEVIVIESGELLRVRRNQIRPDPKFIVHQWDEQFFLDLEKEPPKEKVPLKLDRKNGVVCAESRCTTLYSICPRWSEMRRDKKCVTFHRN